MYMFLVEYTKHNNVWFHFDNVLEVLFEATEGLYFRMAKIHQLQTGEKPSPWP